MKRVTLLRLGGSLLLLTFQALLWQGLLIQFEHQPIPAPASFEDLWALVQLLAKGAFIGVLPCVMLVTVWTGVVPWMTGRSRGGCGVLLVVVSLITLSLAWTILAGWS